VNFKDSLWVRYHSERWNTLVSIGYRTHIVDRRKMFVEDELEDWAYMVLPYH
jgi:hypothetical protein